MYNPEGGRRERGGGTILNELYSPVDTFNSSERNIYYNYYCAVYTRLVMLIMATKLDARGAINDGCNRLDDD